MSSLGFRPPQFSEDLAWQPAWLQNLQVESSATNHINEHQTIITSQFETLSREEGRCNSCHLFLSGEDTSQNSVPSTENALHLCLRLSSYEESTHNQSQELCASQALRGSSKVLLVPQVETCGVSQENANQSKVDGGLKVSQMTSIPKALEKVDPQSPTNNEELGRHLEEKVHHSAGAVKINSISPTMENAGFLTHTDHVDGGQHEDKFNVRHIKDADTSEAVELSIAASEALVIHELLMTGSALEFLPTETILAATLRVKLARLEASEDGIFCSSEDMVEIENLSDLDDSVMENAFLDVGLPRSNLDGQHAWSSDVSRVKDTPVLGNVATLVDPFLYQPAEKISHVSELARRLDDVSSSPALISENAEEGREYSLVADRFRSRWLGGWTVKEVDASAKLKQNKTKGIPNLFNGETSSLSESVDIAADENSFVRKLETGSKIASVSSTPLELDTADVGILVSQEVGSSNQSLVDPLCSVVPCSISSENASSPLAQDQDDREIDAENCFSSKSGHKMENFQRMSDLNVEAVYVDREPMPRTTGECFEAPVRRQLDSLRTYSTLLPKTDAILRHQNQLLSSEHVELPLSNRFVHCHRTDDHKSSKWFLPPRIEFEGTNGRDHEQNQGTPVLRCPVPDRDEPAKDGVELQPQPSVSRTSPLILNQRTRCRLQPSEFLDKKLSGERSPEQIVAQGNVWKDIQRNSCEKIKSKLQHPSNAPNMVRKRVCFSEVEVELQQDEDVQKPKNSRANCFASRANKRSRYSKSWSDTWTRDVKSCLTSHINDGKISMFHGLEFLLTGLSSQKERELVRLIQEYGGMVLSDVPSPPSISRAKRRARSNFLKLPIVVCSKKLQTTKFLYGCAVNAPILKVKWLADSVAAGSVVPPEEYMVLPSQADLQCKKIGKSDYLDDSNRIFYRVGIMLHGKHSFCTKLAIIIKHGGGQVFRTLQRLFQNLDAEKVSVGAIVAEDESRASRHLRQCALERKIPVMMTDCYGSARNFTYYKYKVGDFLQPASWIAKSLHFGKLLPFKEGDDTPTIKVAKSATYLDWSEEI